MFAACRTILQQCVTDVTGLDSLVVGGRWSKNALPQEWLKFLEIGAQGKVISWKVRVACPEILVIISEALNNANDTNKIPSEAEFVKKMMGKALEQQRKFPGVQPDWAYIKRASFGGKAGTLAAKAGTASLPHFLLRIAPLGVLWMTGAALSLLTRPGRQPASADALISIPE